MLFAPYLLKGFGPTTGITPTPAPAGGTSTHYGALLAVQLRIWDLITSGALTEIEANSVRVRKVPYAGDFGAGKDHSLPGVLLVPGPQETIDPVNNYSDDVGYPCVVAILDASPTTEAEGDKFLRWREVIGKEFRSPNGAHVLVSVAPAVTFHTCREEPGPIVDWRRWAADGVSLSVFTLRFFTRQTRGN